MLSFTSFATASRRGYAKHRLSKFKGIFSSVATENFLLHLRECKFRYNTKTTQENLYQKLLKLIRENPIKFNWAKFLYGKYPNNVQVIDKLALAIVKAFNREEAIRWTEKEKNNLINLDVMSDKVFNEIAENKGIEFAELIRFNSPYKNMYELCIDKIMKIGNEIDSKGHLYINFESALPYYKQYGIIDEDSEEIKEFNDIMDFLYLGRRTKLDNFIN